MSHKLVKNTDRRKKDKNTKRILDILSVLLIILFIGVWVRIFQISGEMDQLSEEMVEGIDYYAEEVTILRKDYDSSYSGESSVASVNYYLFYGETWEDKLFVDEDTYRQYRVGDTITAYTRDHVNYGYTPEAMLYKNPKYHNNEMLKAIGVVLGVSIILILFFQWIIGSERGKQ